MMQVTDIQRGFLYKLFDSISIGKGIYIYIWAYDLRGGPLHTMSRIVMCCVRLKITCEGLGSRTITEHQ